MGSEMCIRDRSGEGLRRFRRGTAARPHGRMTLLPRKRFAPKVHRPDSQTHPPPVTLGSSLSSLFSLPGPEVERLTSRVTMFLTSSAEKPCFDKALDHCRATFRGEIHSRSSSHLRLFDFRKPAIRSSPKSAHYKSQRVRAWVLYR